MGWQCNLGAEKKMLSDLIVIHADFGHSKFAFFLDRWSILAPHRWPWKGRWMNIVSEMINFRLISMFVMLTFNRQVSTEI